MDEHRLSRRDTLKLAGFASAALVLPHTGWVSGKEASEIDPRRIPRPFTTAFARPATVVPGAQGGAFPSTIAGLPAVTLVQQVTPVQILPGVQTQMWTYGGTFPGPTILATRRQPIVVRVVNRLPARHPTLRYEPATSTHLHGAPSLPQYDGYANDLTRPGQYKDYYYDNTEDARTIWYHDHAVHRTSENVYQGLAGQYQLRDGDDGLPSGAYDQTLFLSDVAFGRNGQLLFDDNGQSAVNGDVVLVNGRPWPRLPVRRRSYRFRIQNASIGRGYELALSTGEPLVVIGGDGGYLPEPQPVSSLRMGSGERYTVLVDFTRYRPGTRVVLRNRGVENTIDYDNTGVVMAFDVEDGEFDPSHNTVPESFTDRIDPGFLALDAERATATRRLRFGRRNGLWVVNDQTWDSVARSGFQRTVHDVPSGATEIWDLENEGGGWYHPVHLHLVDVKILDRDGGPPRPYETGPKDVVFLGENERVRVVARYPDAGTGRTGRYMIHCHITSHEDHDMMLQYRVGAETAANDPIAAAPPRPIPATWGY